MCICKGHKVLFYPEKTVCDKQSACKIVSNKTDFNFVVANWLILQVGTCSINAFPLYGKVPQRRDGHLVSL